MSRSQSEDRVVISIKQRSQTQKRQQGLLTLRHMLYRLHSPGVDEVGLGATKKNTSGFVQI